VVASVLVDDVERAAVAPVDAEAGARGFVEEILGILVATHLAPDLAHERVALFS
jgi:hypothetical protein